MFLAVGLWLITLTILPGARPPSTCPSLHSGRARGAGAPGRGEEASKVCFSGPLASFVGKNFDTRQDACWGQLRDEAVGSTRRESAHRLTSATLLKDTSERHLRLRTASEDDGLWSDSVSSLDSDFSLSGHVPLARPPK